MRPCYFFIALQVLFTGLFPTSGKAQQEASYPDSLRQVLTQDITAQEQVNTLNQLAEYYIPLDSAQTVSYAQQAIELSKTIGYAQGEAQAYSRIGLLEYNRGNYQTAKKAHLHALDKSKAGEYLRGQAVSLNNLGTLENVHGNYEQALNYFNEGLKVSQVLGNKKDIPTFLNNIGLIYLNQGNYSKSLDFYLKASKINEELSDANGLSSNYINMGVVYQEQGDLNTAFDFFHRALKISQRLDDQYDISVGLTNIGDIYKERGNYDSALYYYRKSLHINQKIQSKDGLGYDYYGIGEVYLMTQNYDSARYYLEKSLELRRVIFQKREVAEVLIPLARVYKNERNYEKALESLRESKLIAAEIGALDVLRDATQISSAMYDELGNTAAAYADYKRFIQLRDSLQSKEEIQLITRMQADFEFRQEKDSLRFVQEKERLAYDVKLAQREKVQIFMLVLLAATIALLGFIFYQNQMRRKVNQRLMQLNDSIRNQRDEIQVQNVKLAELNDEKNLLVGVVAHDLKSPLNQIKGMLSLIKMVESDLSAESQQYLMMIGESVERLRLLISRVLDVSAIEKERLRLKMETVDVREVLDTVCQSFEQEARKKNIRLQTSFPETATYVHADRTYLRQVFENLISNAIKFSPSDKTIFAGVKKAGQKYHAYIQDQGPGLSEKDKAELFVKFKSLTAKPTGDEDSTGLGLVIVKKYVDAMEGDIWCESELGKGARFIVSFEQRSSLQMSRD